MTERENLLSLLRKQGYERVPIDLDLSPAAKQKLDDWADAQAPGVAQTLLAPSYRHVGGTVVHDADLTRFHRYFPAEVYNDPMVSFNSWGVANRRTKSSMHMTQMLHPLEDAQSVDDILQYPFGHYRLADNLGPVSESVQSIHAQGLASMAPLTTTIWETAWYIRGMENLMMDMMGDEPMAEAMLDAVTNVAVELAEIYARAGADMLFLGDDVGMQHSIMMSEELYCKWLKPRLAKVIRAAREIKPDILTLYHSCGYVVPFIPHFIEVGVDVLNPVQPECMDFDMIHEQFGGHLSFYGTIGTQAMMPFGTPDEVRETVHRNLDIAGPRGGLWVTPTHMIEPEVPLENILAYVNACRDYRP